MSTNLSIPYPVKRLPGNTTGRDFVVGDLHGCRSMLEKKLAEIGFDKSCDRLLAVGDLVDRGPESFEALCLLQEPWFESVLGNHEAMLLVFCNQRTSEHLVPEDFINNGGAWIFELNADQLRYLEKVLLPILLNTPLVLHVEDPVAPFNVLHAEAVGLGRGRQLLSDGELREPLLLNTAEVALTWGRRLVSDARHVVRDAELRPDQIAIASPAMQDGLSLTYVGHSVNDGLILHKSHLFIDCGAYAQTWGEKGELAVVNHRQVVHHLRKIGVAL